jgi:hypothetical protein
LPVLSSEMTWDRGVRDRLDPFLCFLVQRFLLDSRLMFQCFARISGAILCFLLPDIKLDDVCAICTFKCRPFAKLSSFKVLETWLAKMDEHWEVLLANICTLALSLLASAATIYRELFTRHSLWLWNWWFSSGTLVPLKLSIKSYVSSNWCHLSSSCMVAFLVAK